METQIRAEADETVLQVLAGRGATVEARELLIVTERMSSKRWRKDFTNNAKQKTIGALR